MWRVITATCTHSYPTRNHSYPTCKHSYPTHCCETPALRPLDSHSSPRLPTAPATAACHLLSPSGPSRSGGPNVGCSNTPALIRLRMYDIGGARRRRWSVRVLRKVNVPTQSQLSEHVRDIAQGGHEVWCHSPIIAPKRNGSAPKIACRSMASRIFLRRSRITRRTFIPARTEKARTNEPDGVQVRMSVCPL
jgi:hypothetical protein